MGANDWICDALRDEAATIDKKTGKYRALALERAAGIIGSMPPINKRTLGKWEAAEMPGIGDGIKRRVHDIVIGGRKTVTEGGAIRELCAIKGVGPEAAKVLFGLGARGPVDVKRLIRAGKWTPNALQKMGLKYWRDLGERIPRSEVTWWLGRIRGALRGTGGRTYPVGSYSRGAQTSGDIDVVVCEGDGLIGKIVDRLRGADLLLGTLGRGAQKAALLVRKPGGKVRQLDLFHAQPEQLIAYLCYGIGDGAHNTRMRGILKDKGYTLNQMGLWRANGSRVPLDSDRDLYRIAGVPYVPPAGRNTA